LKEKFNSSRFKETLNPDFQGFPPWSCPIRPKSFQGTADWLGSIEALMDQTQCKGKAEYVQARKYFAIIYWARWHFLTFSIS
jgi:hypothetical protein